MPMPLSGLAQTLSNSVASIQQQIVATQEQLSAGVKDLNPGQSGVVTRLSAQANSYDQTLQNISAAQSVITVGSSALSSIATILTQMQGLANQASSSGLSSSDRDSLNSTFSSLATQVANLGTSASVNGNNLLAGGSIKVTTGIDGSAAAATTVNGVDIAALATTISALKISASAAAPTNVVTNHVKQEETITFSGTKDTAAATYVIGGLSFTSNATFVALDAAGQEAALATAFANYITGTSLTSANGSFSGASQSAMAAIYSNAVAGATTLVLTRAIPGSQTVTAAMTGGTNLSGSAGQVTANTPAKQYDTVTFNAGLSTGGAVTVGGITYTATTTATATQIATDYYNYIASGTAGVYGNFSGSTSRAAAYALYTATNPSNGVLKLTRKTDGAFTAVTTQDDGASNAAVAISSLTTQLSTVSTGQSTLSAAATGLTAQAKANNALKTGLTDTVNSIQNIDATAMQAKLQQLNNQQSIDYYLVSQMNTEAAAILSIFR
jgi:flagellin-like hook-associated protein FlgL